MIDSTRFDEVIGEIAQLAEASKNEEALNAAAELKRRAEDFELKAVFVGHFSAGKSSLINCLIGRPEFLEEGLNPTTELAAELHFTDGEEYREAVAIDGTVKRIAPGSRPEAEKTSAVRYYLKCEQLAKLGEYTVVDTPGINSGIEKHNKAIAGYLSEGSVFIMVTPAENGGLTKTETAFLKEIASYTTNIAVIVSKCDNVIPQDAESVREGISELLELLGLSAPVFCMSREDPDVSEKLISVITSFDAQRIYDVKMTELISTAAGTAAAGLQTELSGMYLSTYAQDKDIRQLISKKKENEKAYITRRRELEEELINETVENVMQSVSDALESSINRMADAVVLGSREGLEACVAESVRPALMRTLGTAAHEMPAEAARCIGYTESFFNIPDPADERTALDVIGDAVNKISMAKKSDKDEDIRAGGIELLPVEERKEPKKDNSAMYYKAAMAAIGMATGGGLSIPELIVVVLPEIIELLKTLFGESKTDRAKKQLRAVIFPQVREKLYPQILRHITDEANRYMAIIDEEHNKQMKILEEKAVQARTLKENNEAEYDKRCALLENSIERLCKIAYETEDLLWQPI